MRTTAFPWQFRIHESAGRFAEEITCSYHERYVFVTDGKAEVAVGHTTDSDITLHDLLILNDDRRFFSDSFETLLVHNETLDRIAQLRKAFSDLAELKIGNEGVTALIQDYNENQGSLVGRVQALLNRKSNTQEYFYTSRPQTPRKKRS